MSKLVVCSNVDDYNKLDSLCSKNFKKSCCYNDDMINIASYHKLNFDNANFFFTEDDFIFGVGTYIYNNKIALGALEDILKDFDKAFNRNDIAGSYALLIKKRGILYFFVDTGSTYDMFYYIQGNRFIFTNTVFHVAYAKGDNEYLFDDVIIKSISGIDIGDRTFCKSIYRMNGSQIFVFDGSEWQIENWTRFAEVDRNRKVSECVEHKYAGINSLFHKAGMFMTGGQDSRLNLALLMALQLNPDLLYGKGDSLETCTKERDEEVAREIASRFNLNLAFMDWSDNKDQEKNKAEYILKFGEMFQLYGFNTNIMNYFESCPYDLLCFGYFGELVRNVETIAGYGKDTFTLDEYIDDLYLPKDSNLFCKDFDSVRKVIFETLAGKCHEKKIDIEHMEKKDFIKLNSVYRYRADTVMNNFANLFCYSIPFLGDGEIVHELEKVPYAEKNDSRFQMRLIYDFYPELLDVPFFSHIKEKTFNRETFELTEKNKSSKYKEIIRGLIKSPFLMKIARKVYYICIGDKKGLAELDSEFLNKELLINKLKAIRWISFPVEKLCKGTDSRKFNWMVYATDLMNMLDN